MESRHKGCGIALTGLLAWLFLAALLTSCTDWVYDAGGDCSRTLRDPDAAKVEFEVHIHAPSGLTSSPTRSPRLDEELENTVNSLHCLLFLADSDGNPAELVSCLEPLFFSQDETNPHLYNATYASLVPSQVKHNDLRMVLLANATHLLPLMQNPDGDILKMNYTDVKKLLITDLAAASPDLTAHEPLLPDSEPEGMVMWSLPPDLIHVKEGVKTSVQGCLMRDVARVDVKLSQTLKDKGTFDLRDIYIYKPSSTIMHLPGDIAVENNKDERGHPYSYAASPTLHPGNSVYERWDYPEAAREGKIEYTVYIPEGEVIMKGRNGGAGKPRDINHTNRPAVVVGGYFNGNPEMSYYRIDFTNSAGNLIEICRNHLYLMTITDVVGYGQPTPDEAYDNNNIQMLAEVTDWCGIERDVMYDGPDWVKVDKRIVHLTGNAGSGTTIMLESSVPLEQWEFSLGEEGEFTTSNLLQSDHFFVTRPIQEENAKMLIVTKHDIPQDGEPIEERLYVRIGNNVLFYITLIQYPLQGDYWFLADYFAGTDGPWEPVINFPIGGLDPDVPKDNFMEFLKWLFGGDYFSGVGEGDHVSDNMTLSLEFWKFMNWFFTDPFGHMIGGTPDQWDERWDNPIAVLIFNVFKWILGDQYNIELGGSEDPDHPSFVLIGPQLAYEFMDWIKLFDFISTLGKDKEDPDHPSFTELGVDLIYLLNQWIADHDKDIFEHLQGQKPEEGDTLGEPSTFLELIFGILDWLSSETNISGMVGEVKDNPEGGGGNPSSGGVEAGTGDDGWTQGDDIKLEEGEKTEK